MKRIKQQQSEKNSFQKRAIEIKADIQKIDSQIAQCKKEKDEISSNIEIKKLQQENLAKDEQFEQLRKKIKLQINTLQRKSNGISQLIEKKLEKQRELKQDIKQDEIQIGVLQNQLIQLRKGAKLTNDLRKSIEKFNNDIKAVLDADFELNGASQQYQMQKYLETINKYQSEAKILDQGLIQKQSQQTIQIRPFLVQMRTEFDSSCKKLESSRQKIEKKYHAFISKKQEQQQKVREYIEIVDSLTQSKYQKIQLYDQLLKNHQKETAPPTESKDSKSQKQLQNLKEKEQAVSFLRQKQAYLNEMKILIELQHLDASVLESNNFDLPKYKALLTKKAEIMKELCQNPSEQVLKSPEFSQLNKQISTLTCNLNTSDVLVPYKYPIELLLTTKQQLIEQNIKKQFKQQQQQLQQTKQRTIQLLSIKSQFQSDIARLNKEKNQAQQDYKLYTEEWGKKLNEKFSQQNPVREMASSQEIKQPLKPTNLIANLEEITNLSRVFLDSTANKELVENYEKLKVQSAKKQMECLKLEQQYLNPYLATLSLCKPKLPLKRDDRKTAQKQAQLAQLLKKAEGIFNEKKKQGDLSGFRKSNIGLYSSIY